MVPTSGAAGAKNSGPKTVAAARPYRTKSYPSMVVPMKLATATFPVIFCGRVSVLMCGLLAYAGKALLPGFKPRGPQIRAEDGAFSIGPGGSTVLNEGVAAASQSQISQPLGMVTSPSHTAGGEYGKSRSHFVTDSRHA